MPAELADSQPVIPPRAGHREWASLVVLTLPVLLIAVDATVLSFAIPELSLDLAPSSAQLLWIIDIYSFVLAGLLVTMGALGDRIGRRKLLLIGGAGFGVASVLAAYAPNAGVLIAARALLGLSGATLMPSTLSLIRNLFLERRQRRLAIAIWASTFSGGAALGPILGGWILENFWWGSVFLIGLPIMALLLIFGPVIIPESRDPTPGRYDIPSAFLSLFALLPFIFAIKTLAEGGKIQLIFLPALIGVIFGFIFVQRQSRLANPMLDLSLFTNRAFSVAVATNLLSIFALAGSLFYITQYLQLILNLSPLKAGLVILPELICSIIAGLGAVALVQRFSLASLIGVGLLLDSLACLIIARLPLQDGLPLLMLAFVLAGTGIGLVETLTNDAVLAAVPPHRAGAASAISETAYELGAALGTAILGSVLTAVYRNKLTDIPGVPSSALHTAQDTLAGAQDTAQQLPEAVGKALEAAANSAFVYGMRVTAVIEGIIVLYAALQAYILLRRNKLSQNALIDAREPNE